MQPQPVIPNLIPVSPDLIPVLTVFKRLNISKTHGWKLIMSGELERVKIGRKSYCTEDGIKSFIARKSVKRVNS